VPFVRKHAQYREPARLGELAAMRSACSSRPTWTPTQFRRGGMSPGVQPKPRGPRASRLEQTDLDAVAVLKQKRRAQAP
jgi:hypothetical protein